VHFAETRGALQVLPKDVQNSDVTSNRLHIRAMELCKQHCNFYCFQHFCAISWCCVMGPVCSGLRDEQSESGTVPKCHSWNREFSKCHRCFCRALSLTSKVFVDKIILHVFP